MYAYHRVARKVFETFAVCSIAVAASITASNVQAACDWASDQFRYCAQSAEAAQADEEGWGWENEATCIVPNSEADPRPGTCKRKEHSSGNAGKASSAPEVDTLDPRFFYFFGGKTIGGRGFSVGDPDNWSKPLEGLKGRSASGKVEVYAEDYLGVDDAIYGSWSRSKNKGELSLSGPPINIAAVKDLAALTLDIKIHRKPDQDVRIAMDCGWPCRADVNVVKWLRKQPKNKWLSFPIPINCFKSNDFDLTKISGVFMISTAGRMELSIANIRLERLPEGDKGCQD